MPIASIVKYDHLGYGGDHFATTWIAAYDKDFKDIIEQEIKSTKWLTYWQYSLPIKGKGPGYFHTRLAEYYIKYIMHFRGCIVGAEKGRPIYANKDSNEIILPKQSQLDFDIALTGVGREPLLTTFVELNKPKEKRAWEINNF